MSRVSRGSSRGASSSPRSRREDWFCPGLPGPQSGSPNLVEPDTNDAIDIFTEDLTPGHIVRISDPSPAAQKRDPIR